MKKRIGLLGVLALVGGPAVAFAGGDEPVKPAAPKKEPAPVAEAKQPAPRIELAILLDTSGSMDGLINQARTKLWSIVNEMARTKKGAAATDLRVALFEYGNNGVSAEDGYIRRVADLTDDLDLISEKLFALTTNGGSEHCGQAIERAVAALDWSEEDGYKAIFIAGNEPFTQGPVAYQNACKLAIGKGIMVNTIHCGPEHVGQTTGWTDGARLADGQAMNIDHNVETAHIEAPQDERLRELGRKINQTYLAYGRAGGERRERQAAQDRAAEGAAPEAMVERARAKAGRLYKNSEWDLVDKLEEDGEALEKLSKDQLPEAMRDMSPEERKAYIEKKAAEREAIQEEIKKLTAERDAYVAAERKKLAEDGKETFDSAVQAVLKKQLEKKGYSLD